MTFIRKKVELEDNEEKQKDNSGETNCFKQKEDILKQSIKTVGYEDFSQYFIQSGT